MTYNIQPRAKYYVRPVSWGHKVAPWALLRAWARALLRAPWTLLRATLRPKMPRLSEEPPWTLMGPPGP